MVSEPAVFRLQKADVPLASGTEAEIVSDAHSLHPAVHQHLEERVSTHGRQFPGKGDVHQDVHPQFHHELFLGGVVQQPGRFQLRLQAGQGMGAEGKDHQLEMVLPGIEPGGPDHLLVAPVDPVKGPQCRRRRQQMGAVQFVQRCNQFHGLSSVLVSTSGMWMILWGRSRPSTALARPTRSPSRVHS